LEAEKENNKTEGNEGWDASKKGKDSILKAETYRLPGSTEGIPKEDVDKAAAKDNQASRTMEKRPMIRTRDLAQTVPARRKRTVNLLFPIQLQHQMPRWMHYQKLSNPRLLNPSHQTPYQATRLARRSQSRTQFATNMATLLTRKRSLQEFRELPQGMRSRSRMFPIRALRANM
jgi:hypothetical protein